MPKNAIRAGYAAEATYHTLSLHLEATLSSRGSQGVLDAVADTAEPALEEQLADIGVALAVLRLLLEPTEVRRVPDCLVAIPHQRCHWYFSFSSARRTRRTPSGA